MQNERRRGPYTRTWSSTTPPWRSSTSKGKSTSSSKGTSKGEGAYTITWSSTSTSTSTSTWSSKGTSKGKCGKWSSERIGPYTSKGTSRGRNVPNFEGLGKKGGKLRRIWELSEIEARELQRSKERETEACELMQQIFEIEKEYEEQQASRGSSSSNDKENENASDSTDCIYDECVESS